MSQVIPEISGFVYFVLYLINFSLQRSSNSRFGFRIVRLTKVEKFQPVEGNDFHDFADLTFRKNGKRINRSKSKRGANYEVNGTKSVEKVKRNKLVIPVLLRKEAWDCKGDSKNRAAKETERGHNRFRVSDEFGMGSMARFSRHWNLKTGEEIQTKGNRSKPSCSSSNNLTSFLKDLAPPSMAHFVACQSNRFPCKPFSLEVIEDDVILSISNFPNCANLNMRRGDAWAEESAAKDTKSKFKKFFSRFKRIKTSKVKEIRL